MGQVHSKSLSTDKPAVAQTYLRAFERTHGARRSTPDGAAGGRRGSRRGILTQMTRCRLLVAALALLGATGARVHAGEPDDPIWRGLADPEDPGHAAAVARWKGFGPAERLARVRAGIRSEDPVVARLAAEVADPDALALEEIRRAMAHCAADPAWVADPMHALFDDVHSNGLAFGLPDMVSVVRTAATTPGFAFAVDSPFDEYHRAMDASQAGDLVALLETENDDVAKQLVRQLWHLADNTTRDDLRPLFARAFLYGRARSEARAAGKPRPTLVSITASTEGPGVPETVKALVEASIADAQAEGAATWANPWLVRWLHDLRPAAADAEFLRATAGARAAHPAVSAWAVRGLAALDPEGKTTGWRAIAENADAVAAEAAAAELARLGSPTRLRALEDGRGEGAVEARIRAWEVDPADARARWIAAAGAAEHVAPVDLRHAARVRYELELGVHIRDEDVAALGQALVEGGTAKRGAAWFFGNVLPDALTPEVAEIVAKRLAAISEDRYADEDPDAEDLEATLACLEVRAPKVLRDLLAGWVGRYAKDGKVDALRFLARLGDTGFVEPMLATWADWQADQHVLGRVHDPRVVAFLKAKARDPDGEFADEACAALAVALGLPDEMRWSLSPSVREGESLTTDPYETVRQRLLADDAESALLALARGRYVGYLGSLKSERTLATLRRARDERVLEGEAVYWRAIAELAVAGDAAARAEWRAFVRDGRVRMLDGLGVSARRVLVADPESVTDWIPLLNANCCLGFHAWSTLQAAFPTCPVEKIGPVMIQNRVAFERWYGKHRGTFVWSRIVDGFVPGPSRR